MKKTIVAIYDDIVVARHVVEDLVSADFARNSISLITNDAQNQYSHYLDKNYAARTDAVTSGEGAGFGAVVGALTGILVGLAALTIPGIGLAIVAGPIAAGLTGALAGAVTGGIVGALVKSGVPEDAAPYYAEGIRRGGTLVSVETSDTLRAEDIMNRYGSINIHERINVWRQAGWTGLDTKDNKDTDKSSSEMFTPATTDTTAERVTPMTGNGSPVRAEPLHTMLDDEPPIEDGDTAKALPVMVTAPVAGTAVLVTHVPDEMTAEPIFVPVEKGPQVENEDTAK